MTDEMTGGTLVLLVGIVFAALLAWYVIDSILLHMLLRRVGHKHAYAAWVPLWRGAALYEAAGIRQAWVWAGGLYVLNASSSQIPDSAYWAVLGLIVAVEILLAVWIALGIQAGTHVAKGAANGWGAALNAVAPWIWRIWMIVRLGKRAAQGVGYDQGAAIEQGLRLPGRALHGEAEVELSRLKSHAAFGQPQRVPAPEQPTDAAQGGGDPA